MRSTTLALGQYSSCFVTASTGEVVCVGYHITQGFGRGYGAASAGTFTEIQVSDYHVCGLRRDGSISCWSVRASARALTHWDW